MVSVCSIQCFTFLVHLEYLLCLPVFRIRILTFFKVSFITISILRTGSGCGGDFWLGLELGLLWCSMQLAWPSSRHRRFTSSVDLPHAGRPFPWWYKLFHLQPSHSSSLPSSLDYGESQFSRPTLVPVSGSRVMLSMSQFCRPTLVPVSGSRVRLSILKNVKTSCTGNKFRTEIFFEN